MYDGCSRKQYKFVLVVHILLMITIFVSRSVFCGSSFSLQFTVFLNLTGTIYFMVSILCKLLNLFCFLSKMLPDK